MPKSGIYKLEGPFPAGVPAGLDLAGEEVESVFRRGFVVFGAQGGGGSVCGQEADRSSDKNNGGCLEGSGSPGKGSTSTLVHIVLFNVSKV